VGGRLLRHPNAVPLQRRQPRARRGGVEFAHARGASAVEGYAMDTQAGVEITWSELHVGSRNIFADAGMRQVAAPTKRRVVMRIDF
jgi:hypothetical protein